MTRAETIQFPDQAVAMAQAYLDSGIFPSESFRRLVGADVYYGEEFLDLYMLLSAQDRAAFFPILDEPFYRSQRDDLPSNENALVDFLLNGLPAVVLMTVKNWLPYIGPVAIIALSMKVANSVGTVKPPAELVPPV